MASATASRSSISDSRQFNNAPGKQRLACILVGIHFTESTVWALRLSVRRAAPGKAAKDILKPADDFGVDAEPIAARAREAPFFAESCEPFTSSAEHSGLIQHPAYPHTFFEQCRVADRHTLGHLATICIVAGRDTSPDVPITKAPLLLRAQIDVARSH